MRSSRALLFANASKLVSGEPRDEAAVRGTDGEPAAEQRDEDEADHATSKPSSTTFTPVGL